MSDQNKAIVRRFFDEVFNKHNLAFMDQYLAPNAVDHLIPPGMPNGPEGSKQFIGMYLGAFPDLHATIDDMLADGDKVVSRTTYHGTNTGPLMGMPATGKQATVTGMDITRMANGKVVEHWGQLDMLGLMQQLGVVPMPGQGPK